MRPQNEALARKMYDVYCTAVGGKAYNGDPLPDSDTFFADKTKELQSKAWIAAADQAILEIGEYNEETDF